jgi:PAS domain S-box-containing protein
MLLVVIRDITERVRAEEALRETTEELKTYFHFSLDLFCIADTDGYFHRLNREWEKVLGYRLEELEGRKYLDFVHPEDLQASQDVVAMLVEQKEVRNFTNRYRCRDGSYRWIEWRCYPSGKRIFAAARDITERMQTQESVKILAELLDMSPVCVIAHDLNGKLLYANEKTYVLHGWSRDEFLAMDLSKIDTPESARLIAPRIEKIMERGEASFEVSHYRKDGTTFPVLVNVRLARWGNRPIFLSAWTDLTERKDEEAKRLEFERQLLHTQRLESLGVLAGGIAHDFNNLLMAIVGNLDILLMNLPAESPLHNGIEQALKASRRAADLTRQMLAYSGRGRFVVRPLDLGELVRENAHLFRTAISRTITIDLVAAAGLPLIEADPGQVQQVVMNLIINASEAIGEQSGQVKISTGVQACEEADLRSSRLGEKPPPGKFVYLEVADTGCGMDEQTQQRIFDPFFSTKFVGRGLGMPAVLGIVRGHGGAIFMESAPGKGTTIRVLFPAREIREERTVREPSRPVATFSGTILVVDDDESVRSVCMDLLHHLGFSTIEAKDGDQALAIFGERAEEISCVILDLTMPRRDGVGTFQEMKRRRPDVKVILCSGYSEQESLSRFAGEGLAGFLQKPYQLGELKDRIERVLKPAP